MYPVSFPVQGAKATALLSLLCQAAQVYVACHPDQALQLPEKCLQLAIILQNAWRVLEQSHPMTLHCWLPCTLAKLGLYLYRLLFQSFEHRQSLCRWCFP